MALKADICSVMHAKTSPVNGLGFNHSGSHSFSHLSFGNNAPTSLPCFSLGNQIQQHFKYNHKVLCMSSQRDTKCSASVKPSEAEVAKEAPSIIPRQGCPHRTKVVSVKTLAGTKGSIGEICHIVLEHGSRFHFVEGQYLGVILHPGPIICPTDDIGPVGPVIPPFLVIIRDFSIASCRDGDFFDGRTLSLCVRRAELSLDSVSNFLCNAKEGDEVDIIGPFGETMVFPEDPKAKNIMVATATGIAPFRSNIQRLFMDPRSNDTFSGLAWLISGTENYSSNLYHQEFTGILDKNTNNFRYETAYNNSVGDRIYDSGDEIFALLDEGAYMYMAGSKSMMPGILEACQQIAKERGVNWEEMLARLKKNNQWRVEAY